ncbi:hypothetical protein B566_EDAN013695, partial [Ephemera danica]
MEELLHVIIGLVSDIQRRHPTHRDDTDDVEQVPIIQNDPPHMMYVRDVQYLQELNAEIAQIHERLIELLRKKKEVLLSLRKQESEDMARCRLAAGENNSITDRMEFPASPTPSSAPPSEVGEQQERTILSLIAWSFQPPQPPPQLLSVNAELIAHGAFASAEDAMDSASTTASRTPGRMGKEAGEAVPAVLAVRDVTDAGSVELAHGMLEAMDSASTKAAPLTPGRVPHFAKKRKCENQEVSPVLKEKRARYHQPTAKAPERRRSRRIAARRRAQAIPDVSRIARIAPAPCSTQSCGKEHRAAGKPTAPWKHGGVDIDTEISRPHRRTRRRRLAASTIQLRRTIVKRPASQSCQTDNLCIFRESAVIIINQQKVGNKNIKVKSFLIANNVDGIGAIDDVVVKVEYMDGEAIKKKVIFVQCKHVSDPEKKHDELLSKEMIQKYFDSFVTVEEIVNNDVDGISHEAFERNERNRILNFKHVKKITNVAERNAEVDKCMEENKTRREHLKIFLDCDISDCEFLMYTNAKSLEGTGNSIIRNAMDGSNGGIDISHEIFNSVDTTISSHSTFKTLNSAQVDQIKNNKHYRAIEFEYLKEKFTEKFKIYCNQVENLEEDIRNLITRIYLLEDVLENLDIEIQHNFSEEQCTGLSEQTKLLNSVENYSKIKANFFKVKVGSHSYLTSNYEFSDAVKALDKPMDSQQFSTLIANLESDEIIRSSVYLNMTRREKTFVVFLDNVSDLEIWKDARKTKIYKKFNY